MAPVKVLTREALKGAHAWTLAALPKERGSEAGPSAPRKTQKGGKLQSSVSPCGLPGNSPVVYLVTQDGNWGTVSDDVGLIQSTKAPKHPLHRRHPFGREGKST